ncbi:MAG: hypothetical protein ACFFD4_09765 [Candidatus Odinarchaeota archaeon]
MSLLLDILLRNPFVAGTVISVLMLSDLYLTRYSNRLRFKGYNDKIESEVFELNTRQQDLIYENLPVPVKMIVFRIFAGLLVVAIFLLLSWGRDTDSFLSSPYASSYEWFIGLVILVYADTNFIHLRNVALFKYISANPGTITGKIRMSARYAYFQTTIGHLGLSLLWFTSYLLTDRPIFLGGATGELFQMIFMVFWYKSYQKKKKQQEEVTSTE